ncbi:MAG TPA: hypothetical protein PLW80_05275 [Spirochaetales bacterium]|nr:hypothetical protein [Spirochaetales bacterium]
MPFLSLLPDLIRKRPGRVELTVSKATRALYLGLGAILVTVLSRDPSGTPFAVMFALVIGLAAVSEDRWVFDGEASEVRRRTGVLFIAKSWAVDLDMISAIELDSEYNGADQGDPYAKVSAGSPKDRCAIRLALYDGRTLVVVSAKEKRLEELRLRATAIAEAIGKPLSEC